MRRSVIAPPEYLYRDLQRRYIVKEYGLNAAYRA